MQVPIETMIAALSRKFDQAAPFDSSPVIFSATMQVVVTVLERGDGSVDNPNYEVIQVYTPDGYFIAERDGRLNEMGLFEQQALKGEL